MQSNHTKLRWRWGLLAAYAVALLALYPQITLWAERGRDWNGAYAYIDTDEVAYSAYINALTDGRPRRNDPYTGRDDEPNSPQPESLFSIQFAPAYMVAIPARILGLSTSTTFILLLVIAAFASGLTIFRLVWEVTGEEYLAATSCLFVLCLGTLASAQGEIQYLFRFSPAYDNLPFLRRYLPAVSLPFFFIFCTFVWRVLNGKDKRRRRLSAILAGLTFALLVFSYFYLWTSAAVVLTALALLLLLARPTGWVQTLKDFGIVGIFAAAALLPYFILLSHRAPTMDKAQALAFTHAPDLFRSPELIGIIALLALALAAWRGAINWQESTTLFTAALALTPFVVFNQQIVTGRSLQPIHYEQFIINYVSLVAVVLVFAIIWRARVKAGRAIPALALILVALAAFGWGYLEMRAPRDILLEHNRLRDEAVPVIMRLKELDGSLPAQTGNHPIVFSSDDFLSESLPTHTPLGILWARHMHVFSGVTLEENKERLFQQLYYEGTDAREFDDLAHNDFQVLLALFGWERANHNLTVDNKPITEGEVSAEVRNYSNYIAAFDRERAQHPTLSYVVTTVDEKFDFTNLDRWYTRDAGERIGKFMLYRVKLR
ncbi:MAG TPA: hypothetical protein VKB86_18260 [Pyrinomonadaceae bacterium]|nr:hypothetical protein [Pyrinomonadaceae bacterium]